MPKKRRYVVKKYIVATSATSAIRKDKATPVHEVYVSEEERPDLVDAIGFHHVEDVEDDEDYE